MLHFQFIASKAEPSISTDPPATPAVKASSDLMVARVVLVDAVNIDWALAKARAPFCASAGRSLVKTC